MCTILCPPFSIAWLKVLNISSPLIFTNVCVSACVISRSPQLSHLILYRNIERPFARLEAWRRMSTSAYWRYSDSLMIPYATGPLLLMEWPRPSRSPALSCRWNYYWFAACCRMCFSSESRISETPKLAIYFFPPRASSSIHLFPIMH